MTVRPLRDGRYVVETGSGTYVVDLEAGSCGCPDHAIRSARCKHLRRVAMEVTEGAVPAPDRRTGVCAVCGTETFVPRLSAGPHLCAAHAPEPGELVRDRESGKRLVVTAVTDERADAYVTPDGYAVDEYESNTHYGAHEPVIEAVYVGSIRPDRDLADVDRYGFPASRLRRTRRAYGGLAEPGGEGDEKAVGA